MLESNRILKNLSQLFAAFPGIESAALFGSRARGDFNERSDYDVAVYGKLNDSDKARLRISCTEDLPTLHKIDLIFMEQVTDEKFIQNVKKEGIIFYDKDRK